MLWVMIARRLAFSVASLALSMTAGTIVLSSTGEAHAAGGRPTDVSPQREPTCSVTVDNPHWSSTAQTALSKVRFACGTGVSQTYERVTIRLLQCTSRPSGWVAGSSACNTVFTSKFGYPNWAGPIVVGSGKTVTKYAGQSNPDKTTYWIGAVEYGYPGSSNLYRRCSKFVYGPLNRSSPPSYSSSC